MLQKWIKIRYCWIEEYKCPIFIDMKVASINCISKPFKTCTYLGNNKWCEY